MKRHLEFFAQELFDSQQHISVPSIKNYYCSMPILSLKGAFLEIAVKTENTHETLNNVGPT